MKLFVVNEGLFGLNGMQERSIVLVVRTEQEREELEAGIEKLAKEKWRKLFVVEAESQLRRVLCNSLTSSSPTWPRT
ncbi:hypothetical protein BDY24DRAFT_389819 [Mrakia frigida]|uniref:uncharacterized protein n=1 Tax=Mrakia frigida TaxID=29902 RepID=UPI003FCC05D8